MNVSNNNQNAKAQTLNIDRSPQFQFFDKRFLFLSLKLFTSSMERFVGWLELEFLVKLKILLEEISHRFDKEFW